MTRPVAPTDTQLLTLVPHITYDLVQLNEVARRIPLRPAQTIEENAMVDAALLYARKLLAFMDPLPSNQWRAGDVHCVDYAPLWVIPESWWEHANVDVMKAISTRAAHICLARLERLAWNIPAIAGSITEAMLDFMQATPEPYESAFQAAGEAMVP